MKCAFLTLEERGDFYIYDHLAFEPLAELGWQVVEIPWNRPGVNWREYDAVVIRSTWDYQNSPDEFLETLARIESQTRLFNSLEICRWNLNKKYLAELENKGVPIVPTRWLSQLQETDIPALFSKMETSKLVVKPLVSANADDTYVLEQDKPSTWQRAIQVFAEKEGMAQAFISSILKEGEYSLFYFGGEYSHAIVKKPAEGDFRVQEEHGGIISPIQATDDLLNAASKVIAAIGQTLLYARVDLVRLENGQPVLIEVELIEPSLYFEQCQSAPVMFAGKLAGLFS